MMSQNHATYRVEVLQNRRELLQAKKNIKLFLRFRSDIACLGLYQHPKMADDYIR